MGPSTIIFTKGETLPGRMAVSVRYQHGVFMYSMYGVCVCVCVREDKRCLPIILTTINSRRNTQSIVTQWDYSHQYTLSILILSLSCGYNYTKRVSKEIESTK